MRWRQTRVTPWNVGIFPIFSSFLKPLCRVSPKFQSRRSDTDLFALFQHFAVSCPARLLHCRAILRARGVPLDLCLCHTLPQCVTLCHSGLPLDLCSGATLLYHTEASSKTTTLCHTQFNSISWCGVLWRSRLVPWADNYYWGPPLQSVGTAQ